MANNTNKVIGKQNSSTETMKEMDVVFQLLCIEQLLTGAATTRTKHHLSRIYSELL
jgi:hypothetical protein